MTLATGTQLGPYEDVAPLGAGGMGRPGGPRLRCMIIHIVRWI
jgi:hypothetical protein